MLTGAMGEDIGALISVRRWALLRMRQKAGQLLSRNGTAAMVTASSLITETVLALYTDMPASCWSKSAKKVNKGDVVSLVGSTGIQPATIVILKSAETEHELILCLILENRKDKC